MNDSRVADYALLDKQLRALLDGETDTLASTANFVALINDSIVDINWCGIYVLRGGLLKLGPFQGKAACTSIPLGDGVCGTAAASGQSLRVADVNAFAGHISCDSASLAELVIPLLVGDKVLGVLDIDSPFADRFSAHDQIGVEMLCNSFLEIMQLDARPFI